MEHFAIITGQLLSDGEIGRCPLNSWTSALTMTGPATTYYGVIAKNKLTHQILIRHACNATEELQLTKTN